MAFGKAQKLNFRNFLKALFAVASHTSIPVFVFFCQTNLNKNYSGIMRARCYKHFQSKIYRCDSINKKNYSQAEQSQGIKIK